MALRRSRLLAVALTLPNIGFMLIGITLGVLIGVLPGLGGADSDDSFCALFT